uniref:Coat protein n=1 Tax=Peanut clump virus N TaxID=188886 RepID=Q8B0Y8_9VIRU|nr:coat protein [Peanut clump virus N]
MPNINLGHLGNGHYSEDVFEEKIYEAGVDQDWWIEQSNYDKLLSGLRAVNFEVNSSRQQVAKLINNVDKDLPANPGVRFPASRGTLGSADYKPYRFRRIDSTNRGYFEDLVRISDQGKSRDTEINRPAAPTVGSNSQGTSLANNRGLSVIRDEQPLRDGAQNFGHTFTALSLSNIPTYNQRKFEREFSLSWTAASGHHTTGTGAGTSGSGTGSGTGTGGARPTTTGGNTAGNP